jgi:1-acyl-sn-glycerol-3-phosphate acyltransferase
MNAVLWAALNILQWLLVALWTVIWTVPAMLLVALTRRPRLGLAMARRFWAPPVLWVGGVRVEVSGAERLDPECPWFLACNHQSFSDIPILFRTLPADLRFVAKRELRSVPFLGWYMEVMGMIFVDRRRRSSGAAGIDAAAELLRNGGTVLSFPAGTRRTTDQTQGFKPAAFAPAIAAGVPVVPVAIYGSPGLLHAGTKLRPGLARVMVGEAIPTAGMPLVARNQVAHQAEAAVAAMLAQMAADDLGAGVAKVEEAAAATSAKVPGAPSFPIDGALDTVLESAIENTITTDLATRPARALGEMSG